MSDSHIFNPENSIINIGADFVSIAYRDVADAAKGDVENITFLREENPRLFNRARTAAATADYKALNSLSNCVFDDFKEVDSRFEVKAGKVFFQGRGVNNFATERISELWKQGLPTAAWVNFIKNTMLNTHAITVEDTFRFMQGHEGCPVTEDGALLAYKKVDHNYMSFFRSRITNKRERWKPGDTVELPRDQCDPDRTSTCSAGLHFCSRSYLPNMFGGSGKIVMVKIFPQDIVAIPTDYGLAKGRCCKAYVVKDIPDYDNFAFSSCYTQDGSEVPYRGAADVMDPKTFNNIETMLAAYAKALIDTEGELTDNVNDLIDRIRVFADSVDASRPFVYDEEDVIHVLENSEDPYIQEVYDIEFTDDVRVSVGVT